MPLKKILSYLIFLVCIPLAIALGMAVFGDRQYAFAAAAVAVLSCIPFFISQLFRALLFTYLQRKQHGRCISTARSQRVLRIKPLRTTNKKMFRRLKIPLPSLPWRYLIHFPISPGPIRRMRHYGHVLLSRSSNSSTNSSF